jgi:Na+:H+ antiporter, NhaC family
MIAVLIGRRRGLSFEQLRDAASASVNSGLGAIFILFAVGSLIGTWAMSGTLLAMVYYGHLLLSPDYFYMTAAAICAVVSASIGSSWTVVGTIGIGLMGISASMGLNPSITAGAIISGAYFGDKSSPLSDSANLAAAAAGVDLYRHIRETLITSAIALPLALLFFFALGQPGDFDASDKMTTIASAVHITPVLFLPLLVVAFLAATKFPPFTSIFLGALTAGLLAVFVSPDRVIRFADAGDHVPTLLALLKGVWMAFAGGYTSDTGYAVVDELASRGGMASMLDTIWLVIAALAFGGVVERTGVLTRLITPIIDAAKSTGAFGVATFSYAPFAVFNLISPLLTIAIGYAGFRMLRTKPGEQVG